MTSSKWIWGDFEPSPDSHVDFLVPFECNNNASIKISADSNYTLFINGNFVNSGQYPDFPHYKVYDNLDITPFCNKGKNVALITVWYYGISDSFTYYKGDAVLRFEITDGDTVVARSDENTLSRKNSAYVSGCCKKITPQLGLGFHYDITGENSDATLFSPSRTVDGPALMFERPIKKLVIGAPLKTTLINSENGTRFLYDMGFETVGYLSLKISSSVKQTVTVSFGEHIIDGGVRRVIGSRDFSVKITLGVGQNDYTNYFRRFGLRYLELTCDSPVTVDRLSVCPCDYPVKKIKRDFNDPLRNKIYDVSVRTLELCMHDHYEDCPWREQSFYTMDSRNQMLCGYYAFEEYAFARASLLLAAGDKRADNHLCICFPSDADLTIPSFTLHYITQVYEYTTYSGDTTLAKEVYPKLVSIINTFKNSMQNDLVPNPEGKSHWNFYEWSDGLDGRPRNAEGTFFDCVLNSLFSIALQNMQKLCELIGTDCDYSSLADKVNDAINNRFFDGGIYYDRNIGEKSGELTNALCVLCGAAKDVKAVAKILADKNSGLTPITLSMLTFKYEALLKADSEKYRDYILNDIDARYTRMLDAGATTFWETEKGAADFHNAGSLCHGWSAMPIYYYTKLL